MINSISGASPIATQAASSPSQAQAPKPPAGGASSAGTSANVGPAVIVNLSSSHEVNDMAQGDPDHDGH